MLHGLRARRYACPLTLTPKPTPTPNTHTYSHRQEARSLLLPRRPPLMGPLPALRSLQPAGKCTSYLLWAVLAIWAVLTTGCNCYGLYLQLCGYSGLRASCSLLIPPGGRCSHGPHASASQHLRQQHQDHSRADLPSLHRTGLPRWLP